MRGINRMKRLLNERGSYTIEACIALVAFLVAIMFIYSQIKVLIAESILQNAVNNMAKETAAYVYLLDKTGLVFEHKDGSTGNIDSALGEVSELMDSLTSEDGKTSLTSPGSGRFDVSGIGQSVNDIVDCLKSVDEAELKNAAKEGAESLSLLIGNKIIEAICANRLSAYLPMEKEQFCKAYMIKNDSFSFANSKLFPNNEYNVFIAVECETVSPFKAFPMNRHIAKYACTAAWVSGNAN